MPWYVTLWLFDNNLSKWFEICQQYCVGLRTPYKTTLDNFDTSTQWCGPQNNAKQMFSTMIYAQRCGDFNFVLSLKP